MTEILDVAPIDLLHGLSKDFLRRLTFLPEHLRSQGLDIEFHWITEKGDDGDLTANIKIKATESFATCPPLDILLMGAHWSGDGPVGQPSEAEIEFVRKAYDQCTAFISICGGVMIPLAAGVLDGKTCTAPRPFLSNLKNDHPKVNWVEKRYVNDGKTWTSGTLLNGLDLMRAFVDETWGGPGTLAEMLLYDGAWPVRDVDYKDV
nr:isonitrile hydratase [Quercus suber]